MKTAHAQLVAFAVCVTRGGDWAGVTPAQRAPVPLTFTAAITTHFPVIFGTSMCMHMCVWSFSKLGWAYFRAPVPEPAAALDGDAPPVDTRQVAETRCQVPKPSYPLPAVVATRNGVARLGVRGPPCFPTFERKRSGDADAPR